MIVTIQYDDGHKASYKVEAIKQHKSAWEEVCDLCKEDYTNFMKERKENAEEVNNKNRD